MNTPQALTRLAAAVVATLLGSAEVAAQGLPPAVQGERAVATSADLPKDEPLQDTTIATFDVFIDGRTGYAFVRTPRGWVFVRDLRADRADLALKQ